jgi:hypothetical protein
MKIEKCPFCDKAVAEITNCKDLEECRHFEKCPATEPYVCVVCNMFEGGCGASSGYYDSVEKAIAAWNRRAQPENEQLVRCENCSHWDKTISFMSANACAFWSSGKKTRYTENYEFCSFAERKEE